MCLYHIAGDLVPVRIPKRLLMIKDLLTLPSIRQFKHGIHTSADLTREAADCEGRLEGAAAT